MPVSWSGGQFFTKQEACQGERSPEAVPGGSRFAQLTGAEKRELGLGRH
jgi:hypothetical protein